MDADHIQKGISAIVVGPGACKLNYPKVQISKADGEVAIWVAKKKTDKLRIEFDDEVFKEMDKINGKWRPGKAARRYVTSLLFRRDQGQRRAFRS